MSGEVVWRPTEIQPANPLGRPPVGSRVKSGHWWVFIEGGFGTAQLWLNGQEYRFPRGEWFVVEDDYFKVIHQSDLPIYWLYGDEVRGRSTRDVMREHLESTGKIAKISGKKPPLIEG